MNLPSYLQWFVVLAPLLPILLHATGLEKTTIGAIVVRLLPDVLGAIKKAAAAPPEK